MTNALQEEKKNEVLYAKRMLDRGMSNYGTNAEKAEWSRPPREGGPEESGTQGQSGLSRTKREVSKTPDVCHNPQLIHFALGSHGVQKTKKDQVVMQPAVRCPDFEHAHVYRKYFEFNPPEVKEHPFQTDVLFYPNRLPERQQFPTQDCETVHVEFGEGTDAQARAAEFAIAANRVYKTDRRDQGQVIESPTDPSDSSGVTTAVEFPYVPGITLDKDLSGHLDIVKEALSINSSAEALAKKIAEDLLSNNVVLKEVKAKDVIFKREAVNEPYHKRFHILFKEHVIVLGDRPLGMDLDSLIQLKFYMVPDLTLILENFFHRVRRTADKYGVTPSNLERALGDAIKPFKNKRATQCDAANRPTCQEAAPCNVRSTFEKVSFVCHWSRMNTLVRGCTTEFGVPAMDFHEHPRIKGALFNQRDYAPGESPEKEGRIFFPLKNADMAAQGDRIAVAFNRIFKNKNPNATLLLIPKSPGSNSHYWHLVEVNALQGTTLDMNWCKDPIYKAAMSNLARTPEDIAEALTKKWLTEGFSKRRVTSSDITFDPIGGTFEILPIEELTLIEPNSKLDFTTQQMYYDIVAVILRAVKKARSG